MTVGEVTAVPNCPGVHYVDTGMYDVEGYGCAYVVDAERPAVVETGIGAHHDRVLDALDAVGVDRTALEAIAVTHVHLDHAGGAGFLAAACPNASVHVHEAGAPHLVDPSRLVAGTKRAVGDQWEFYADPEPVPADRVVELADGDAVDLGDRRLDVHGAPGHAPHQVVFHDRLADAVFTGDAAGIWIPGRESVHPTTPPPDFDLSACLADVAALREIAPETLLFTHVGPGPDDVDGVLSSYADTLRDWVATVRERRAALGDDEAVIEALVEENDVEAVWGRRKARAEVAMNVRGVLHYLDNAGV